MDSPITNLLAKNEIVRKRLPKFAKFKLQQGVNWIILLQALYS